MHYVLGLILFGLFVALSEFAAHSEPVRRQAVAQKDREQVPIRAILKASTEKFGRLDLLFCFVSFISCALAGFPIWIPIVVSLALLLTQVMYYHSISVDSRSRRAVWSGIHGVLLFKGAVLPPIFALLLSK